MRGSRSKAVDTGIILLIVVVFRVTDGGETYWRNLVTTLPSPALLHVEGGSREGAGFSRLALRGGHEENEEYFKQDEWEKMPVENFPADINIRPTFKGEYVFDGGNVHSQERFRDRNFVGEDISGDGGVMMRFLQTNVSEAGGFPVAGDYVYVHYRGYLDRDGRQFEDSRASPQLNGRPFGFCLGNSDVIDGWERAVKRMRVGDVCEVRITPQHATSADGIRLKGLLPYTAMNHDCAVPEREVVRFEIELVEFGMGRRITADGRVRYLEHSFGVDGLWRRRPNITAGDEVEIRYTGYCGGAEFVKTDGIDRVRLGRGLLPRGLEMVLGEWMGANGSATVRLWGEYAVNQHWVPPAEVLATGACFEYKVELIDWSGYEEMCDGQVIVKCCGVQDREWAEYGGDITALRYLGKVYDDDDVDDCDRVALAIEASVQGKVVFKQSHFECELGDGSLPVGVEMAILKLRERQEGFITIFSDEFLHAGRSCPVGITHPTIAGRAPGVPVEFRVVYKGMLSTFYYRQTGLADKISASIERKEQGNRLFAAGVLKAALQKYQDAYTCIEYEETDDPAELVDINSPSCETIRVPEQVKSSLYDLKCAIQLNRATCYQRLNENKLALEMCEDVLKISPKHVKALYKRSLIALARGDFDLALTDMMAASEVEPLNDSITRKLAVIRGKIAAHKRQEKAVYSGFFDR